MFPKHSVKTTSSSSARLPEKNMEFMENINPELWISISCMNLETPLERRDAYKKCDDLAMKLLRIYRKTTTHRQDRANLPAEYL